MKTKGFNLIEVILAVLIIGILAGIVWGMLNPGEIFNLISSSRTNNNIKALDKAFESYALDNQGNAPEILALANNQPYMIINGAGTYDIPLDCNQAVGDLNTTTINSIVPNYLPSVPADQTLTNPNTEGSGYYVIRKGSEVRVGACNGDYDFSNGLVGLWHMDESSWIGVNKILDSTSNLNHGTALYLPVPTATDPKMGAYAGDFDVAGDAFVRKVVPSGLPSGNVAKTIMAWAKASSACSSTSCVIGGYGNLADGENFQMAFNGSSFTIYGWGGGYDWNTGVDNTSYFNDWHHFVLTYNPPTTNFYIDGELKATTNSYSWNTNPQYMIIGNEIDGNTRKFQGQIDEFSIWNRALSLAEIKAIYALEK